MGGDTDLVEARDISEQFNMPRHVIYRLVKDGVIIAYEQPRQPWHKRKHYKFSVRQVAEALEALRQPRPK